MHKETLAKSKLKYIQATSQQLNWKSHRLIAPTSFNKSWILTTICQSVYIKTILLQMQSRRLKNDTSIALE